MESLFGWNRPEPGFIVPSLPHEITQESDVMIVPDARLDARFAQLPLAQEDPHIQFYTGARLSD
jgi:hypothetical protein